MSKFVLAICIILGVVSNVNAQKMRNDGMYRDDYQSLKKSQRAESNRITTRGRNVRYQRNLVLYGPRVYYVRPVYYPRYSNFYERARYDRYYRPSYYRSYNEY